MSTAFQLGLFQADAVEATIPDVLVLSLADARTLTAALSDRRSAGAFADARTLTAALALGPLPELIKGAVLGVGVRVPSLTTTGTPGGYSTAWWAVAASTVAGPGPVSLGAGIGEAILGRYLPGLLVAPAGTELNDVLRATDSLGATVDTAMIIGDPAIVEFWRGATPEFSVEIGTDGFTSVGTEHIPRALQLLATDGTAPYTWTLERNGSGATIDSAGLYTAGDAVEEDVVLVADSLGAQSRVTIGVNEAELWRAIGDVTRIHGVLLPEYPIRPLGGTGPYVLSLTENESGATVTQPRPRHLVMGLSLDGAPIDLTGWTFVATVYSQRGAVMADGLAVYNGGGTIEVALPDPGTLPLPTAVVRVTATTAGAVAARGYPTLELEALLTSEV